MKSLISFAIAMATILAATMPAHAEQASLPTREAGKWKIKTIMDEGKGPKEQVLTMCVDADMEKHTAHSSLREHQANCTKYEIKKVENKVVVDAVCKYGNANVESTTEMKGDFKKDFLVTISSKTVPPSNNGQSRVIKRTINQTGTYLGADCGDLKPGQAMGTDGDKIFVQ